MRCEMTFRDYPDYTYGIWDDGEWISWDWINGQIEKQEWRAQFPNAYPELVELFKKLVLSAAEYKEATGNYLQIWGELGELYAESHLGLKRHRPHAPGSDGKIGNDFVEVKTISPERTGGEVFVKRSGNFNKLLVVKIDADFRFESRLIDRSALPNGGGKKAKYVWTPEAPDR